MLDLRWIRDNPDAFDAALKRRGLDSVASAVLALDAQHRSVQTELQEMQTRRNEASKQVGAAKAKGGDAGALMSEVAALKDRMQALEAREREVGQKVAETVATLPNVAAPDVPDGADAAANVVLRTVGDKPRFDFAAKDHAALGEGLAAMDFARAAKLSGSRFVVLSGALARLERALAAFMLDLHTKEFGYVEVSPPLLVRDDTLFGTGQLPKFKDDLFVAGNLEESLPPEKFVEVDFDGKRAHVILKDAEDIDRLNALSPGAKVKVVKSPEGQTKRLIAREQRWLIPTAEVPLTNLVANDILDEKVLPLRFTAHTPCFRSEAGAAGRDTHGMLRQHQFNKVELVSIAHPDRAAAEHERMTGAAEEVLRRLGLHYRVVLLCAGDMGFAARKTYDLEVWLPGQDAFREISSCSDCGDFQARRMRARFRPEGGKGTRFVHTLNGSGLAVGRTLIAVLENYQQQDGSIAVPPALRPHMDGLEIIRGGG
jgi:seryl-tRNA synthetase